MRQSNSATSRLTAPGRRRYIVNTRPPTKTENNVNNMRCIRTDGVAGRHSLRHDAQLNKWATLLGRPER